MSAITATQKIIEILKYIWNNKPSILSQLQVYCLVEKYNLKSVTYAAAAAAKSLQSCPTLVTPWTAAYQAPPSTGFSRQEYWSGVPLPSPVTYAWA